MNSLGSRVAGTVALCIGWLVFILMFLAFYAGNFDLWQNIAIFLVSALVAIGMIAVMWIKWALK
ncbi:MAG: hypothetical protein ACE5KD_01620 [Candidatus Bathyarchaeia archaeon]